MAPSTAPASSQILSTCLVREALRLAHRGGHRHKGGTRLGTHIWHITFFQGGPGSGKGTQCEKLVEKYGFTHLSTGELLRNELASTSERSKLIRDIMERGDLVPSVSNVRKLLPSLVAEVLGPVVRNLSCQNKETQRDRQQLFISNNPEPGRSMQTTHLPLCLLGQPPNCYPGSYFPQNPCPTSEFKIFTTMVNVEVHSLELKTSPKQKITFWSSSSRCNSIISTFGVFLVEFK